MMFMIMMMMMMTTMMRDDKLRKKQTWCSGYEYQYSSHPALQHCCFTVSFLFRSIFTYFRVLVALFFLQLLCYPVLSPFFRFQNLVIIHCTGTGLVYSTVIAYMVLGISPPFFDRIGPYQQFSRNGSSLTLVKTWFERVLTIILCVQPAAGCCFWCRAWPFCCL